MQRETISQLLNRAPAVVRPEARLLLAEVLKCEPTFLIAHPEIKPTKWQKWQYSWLLFKRTHGTPLAYITGRRAFYGREFWVNKHTLIPRPETEVLVEAVIRLTKKYSNEPILILDVGTGSGCIPITLSKEISAPNVNIFASDISKKALQIAEKNNVILKSQVTFYHSNLLANIPLEKLLHTHRPTQIIITANLPYLTKFEFQTEPSISKEPKSALIAPDHGLYFYKHLLTQFLQSPLKNLPTEFLFEINPAQTTPLQTFANELFPKASIKILPDLAGLNRVFCLTLPKQ